MNLKKRMSASHTKISLSMMIIGVLHSLSANAVSDPVYSAVGKCISSPADAHSAGNQVAIKLLQISGVTVSASSNLVTITSKDSILLPGVGVPGTQNRHWPTLHTGGLTTVQFALDPSVGTSGVASTSDSVKLSKIAVTECINNARIAMSTGMVVHFDGLWHIEGMQPWEGGCVAKSRITPLVNTQWGTKGSVDVCSLMAQVPSDKSTPVMSGTGGSALPYR